MIRIGFFWTPSLARAVLSDILSDPRFEVAFVLTNPDKPFGREQQLKAPPVKELAVEKNIPIFQPEKVRWNEELFKNLSKFDCDYFVVVAYGKILPKEVLYIPKKLCINVHGSLLPKYRWASPIQSALLEGERETGVTIMQMSEGMDEWDSIYTENIAIDETETSETLFEKFIHISGKALIQGVIGIDSWALSRIPQDGTKATYCKKIEKEDGLVDWTESNKKIYQKWQAYTPWPGIYTLYEGKRLLLEKVTYQKNISGKIWTDFGKVIQQEDGNIWVICSEWLLTLEQVKLEWKKSQNIKDFVNGNQKFIWYNFL
jgi:methionyl-tRNA formyltransferase